MLSIIVAWRDRMELSRALPSMLEAARLTEGEVTVVNYSGDRRLLEPQLSAGRGDVRVIEVLGERYFNKSRAQNVGASCTSEPLLFFCDCDIVLDPVAVHGLAQRVLRRDDVFATLAGVRESEVNSRGGRHVVSFGYELKIRTSDGRQLTIVDSEEDAETGARQAPGLLFVKRSDFIAVNGYNANLHGWGWEDQDMISRLTLGRGLTRLVDGLAVHLSHDDNARIANYPPVKDRWESRDRMFRTALANYDNRDFQGTFADDAAHWSARCAE